LSTGVNFVNLHFCRNAFRTNVLKIQDLRSKFYPQSRDKNVFDYYGNIAPKEMKNVQNVSITEPPRLGQAALKLRATTQLLL
jgi:hypothetical protein